MLVLGISAGFHDSAAALVEDGVIVAAVEQERLTRLKHDASFPDRAIDVSLAAAGFTPGDIDLVVHHERPVAALDRYVATRLATAPFALRSVLLDAPRVVRQQLGTGHRVARWFRDHSVPVPEVRYSDHHVSHAAAAFFPSPFEHAAVLTIDGVGEWATATRGSGHGRHLSVDDELTFPDSVGLLYSAFTEYCGFSPNGGEGELMGLAPFGAPRFVDQILERLVDVREDGAIRLDQQYFAYLGGRRMTGRRFHSLFGGAPRPAGSTPTHREADLAASIQAVIELIVLRMARDLHERTGATNLCLGGGVGLNCVVNGVLRRRSPFDDIWVQPAAGDSGAAIGAALAAWFGEGGERKIHPDDGMSGARLGPSFSAQEVAAFLDDERVPYRRVPDPTSLDALAAGRLAQGEVIGWFEGRMEFGPRALGNRSILADPRSPTVQERINREIKHRAPFRPFAPAVLAEHASDWFDLSGDRPYMTFAAGINTDRRFAHEGPVSATVSERVREPRSSIPAVTHVDYSARVQTVDDRHHPRFASLIRAFHSMTDCPMLLNTSFNGAGEPIVCTPDDALATFRRTGLDLLVLEDCVVEADR